MKLIDVLVGSGDGMSLFGLRTKYLAMDPDGRVYGYTEMPTAGIIGWSVPDNLYSTDGRGCLIQIDRDDVDGQWQSAIITREQYEAALFEAELVDAVQDKPAADGWIEWGGGECPVNASEMVDVMFGCGGRVSTNIADCWRWNHSGTDSDIIAYRLHKPTKSEQVRAAAWNTYAGITEPDAESDLNECIGQNAAPVWNGEGLPPVGCEFEYGSHRTKAKCLAVAHHMVFASKGNPDDEESDYEELMISILDSEFHPVRTEAERKRDEAVKTIMLTGWCQAAAEEIYDLIAAGKVPGMKLED